MYHYIESEPGLWTVGTGTPKSMGGNDWLPESDHDSPEKAAARVRFLNGGNLLPETDLIEAIKKIRKLELALKICVEALEKPKKDDERLSALQLAQDALEEF